jgi:hypothetical protein
MPNPNSERALEMIDQLFDLAKDIRKNNPLTDKQRGQAVKCIVTFVVLFTTKPRVLVEAMRLQTSVRAKKEGTMK